MKTGAATGSAMLGNVLTARSRSMPAPSSLIRATRQSLFVQMRLAGRASHGTGKTEASSGRNSGRTAFCGNAQALNLHQWALIVILEPRATSSERSYET